jgi:hypothetical protein
MEDKNIGINVWIHDRNMSINKLTRNSKIISFHFKVTHRVLACKYNLNIWKIEENNICDYCHKYEDCIEHHLVACVYTRVFWDAVLNWWKASMCTIFPLDTYDIIFGLENESNDKVINQLNYIMLHGIYYVYVSKQAKKELDVYNFLLDCKNKLLMEQEIMSSQDRSDSFEKNWRELLNIL